MNYDIVFHIEWRGPGQIHLKSKSSLQTLLDLLDLSAYVCMFYLSGFLSGFTRNNLKGKLLYLLCNKHALLNTMF